MGGWGAGGVWTCLSSVVTKWLGNIQISLAKLAKSELVYENLKDIDGVGIFAKILHHCTMIRDEKL